MKCSKCDGIAVIQWKKLHSDEEADAHIAEVHSKLADQAEAKRLDLRVRMAALQDAFASPPSNLSPQDVVSFQERATRQIEQLRDQHNKVPTTFNLDSHREGSGAALAHCAEHRYDDLEWYARVHQPTCSGEIGCGCS